MESASLEAIGVVIPGYGHPQFLAEAIISACEQKINRKLYVVVVDDGCKFPETAQIVSHLMAKYPGILHYLRQENTRLPGARNTGIRFLMALAPRLDSIYFLDADNRIAPNSIGIFRQTLGDDPTVGWAYPDISMFGISRSENGFDTRETAPEYSQLKHLVGNISEAGSLVRAEVFRSGVFFNEAMTSGFEDWDFWLSALEAGYIGRRTLYSGFLYRRRMESMLAESRRLEDTLIARIRETHKNLYLPKTILGLEQKEAPIFAFYITDTNDVFLTSDLKAKAEKLDRTSFKACFQRWLQNPHEVFFPEYLISLSSSQWDVLKNNPGHVRWILWRLREETDLVTSVSLQSTDHFEFHVRPADITVETQMANFLFLKTTMLRSFALQVKDAVEPARKVSLPIPKKAHIGAPALLLDYHKTEVLETQLRITEQFIEELMPMQLVSKHQSRRYAGPSCMEIRHNFISEVCAVEERAPFPVCGNRERIMVFVTVDQLASSTTALCFHDLLKRLKVAGYDSLVILEHGLRQSLASIDFCWWPEADDVVPVEVMEGSVEYRLYLGRRIAQKLGLVAKEDITVLARSCDAFLFCGITAGLDALGQAKMHGAKGHVLLDPMFMEPDTIDLKQQAKLLAYEHAISTVVTDDASYFHLLSAEGFPPSKFQSSSKFWAKDEEGTGPTF